MSQRVGVSGITANPIHFGHLDSAESVRQAFNLDYTLLMVSAQTPHKSEAELALAHHRLTMTELAVITYPALRACRMELDHPSEPYTYQTVDRLHVELGDIEIFWTIGSDWFSTMQNRWQRFEYLVTQANLVIVERPGYELPEELPQDFPVPVIDMRGEKKSPIVQGPAIYCIDLITSQDISSSMLREKIRTDQSLTNYLPAQVEEYITKYCLYRE